MPAKLKDTPLKREIKVLGIEFPVIIGLTALGLSIKVKGSHKELTATWTQVAEKMPTCGNIKPSYLANDPIKFLQHQVLSKKGKAK